MNTKSKKQNGFTLIEIMIAIVVFSFGLLGVAGIMTVAVKSNHNGYMRSQASFMASTMLDMMRRNIRGVWANNYNVVVSTYADISSMCNAGNPCNAAGLAARDVQMWANSFSTVLPNATGQINCVQGSPLGDTTAQVSAPFYSVEPYSGICTITMRWSESNETSANSQQVLVLPGKP